MDREGKHYKVRVPGSERSWKSSIPTHSMLKRVSIWGEDWDENEVEWIGKAKITKLEFLAVSEAGKVLS